MIKWLLFPLLLSAATSHSMASSLCEQLLAQPEYLEEERSYLLRMCDMSLPGANGPIIHLENGFLPLLNEFYVKIPEKDEIALASSLSPKLRSFDRKMDWPYGVIWIRPIDRSKTQENAVQEEPIHSEVLSEASNMCGFGISLIYYEERAPDLDFVGKFFELKIGDTVVLFGGGSEALAIVTGEMFARLNCQ